MAANDTLFFKRKPTKPKDVAKAADIKYNAVRKWRQVYDTISKNKKKKCISNRPVSLLNDQPNDYLVNSECLIQSFTGLKN